MIAGLAGVEEGRVLLNGRGRQRRRRRTRVFRAHPTLSTC